jgi:class 3 adenylate cyclase
VARTSAPAPSLFGGLLERAGNPLEWSAANRALLVAGGGLFLTIVYALGEYYLLVHPGLAPYLDRAHLRRHFEFQVWAISGGWLALALAALALRRRRPESRLLVFLTTQFYFSFGAIGVYLVGHHTALVTGILLLAGGAAVVSLLFGTRMAMAGAASFFLVVIGTSLGELNGTLPPGAGTESGDWTSATSWLAGIGAVNFLVLLVVLCFIYISSDRLEDHQHRLARTSEQLSRATDLISRYVAAQVAEQILCGNYGAVERQERRKLTIFFSDIKGFTEIADRVEPEDLSRVLNEYLGEMTEIAGRHGGTIDKFVGDAIMILFGAPQATDDRDHALRAVRMAVEMQARMVGLRARWQSEGIVDTLHVRIGVNTGVASVGNFGTKGRMDYTAIGRQVNLAARLQASCEPDDVLISHATAVLVQDEIPCIARGEIAVKGFVQPVKVYAVAAPTSAAAAGGSARG